jgi:hypothetical protein
MRGNRIVEGHSGIFTIVRESYNDNQWKKLFRSKRKQNSLLKTFLWKSGTTGFILRWF